MFELRVVGTECAGQLAELWSKTFRQAYRDVHASEDIDAYCRANFTLELASAALSNPGAVCCFGYKGTSPRGFYLVKHHNCPIPLESKSSELKQIYVLAKEYGTGLGRLLYAHAIECLRADGSQWVWLSVADNNDRAQAFYKKLGFERLGTGPVFEVGSERLTSSIMVYGFDGEN